MSAANTSLRGSATERVRRLLPFLDEHGAEMDRRRELTPEVVKALVEEDMLRLLLPRSISGQEIDLLEFCKVCELAGGADDSAGWFITQCNVSSSTSAADVLRHRRRDVRRTADRRMRLRLATTLAMKEGTDVSVACYRAAGTTAIRISAPFERRLRDALSASQHVQGALPLVEMVGRHIIGTDNVIALL